MKSKKILIPLLTIGGLTALGVGMYYHFKNQFDKALKYCYKFEGYDFVEISEDGIILDLFLKFQNKSDIDIILTGYKFDIIVNGKYVGNIQNKVQELIKANDISNITARLTFNPKNFFKFQDILKLIAYTVSAKHKFKIRITGGINVQSNFITIKNIPVEYNTNLKELTDDKSESEGNTDECDI